MSGEEDLMKQVEELKRRLREVEEKRGDEERKGKRESTGRIDRKGRRERKGIRDEGIGCWRVCEQGNGLCSACGATRYGKQ